MAYDQHANLAYATVAVAPSPALSGTSLTVANGLGALFPTAPFNCTVYPPNSNPLATNAEIVRVTNKTGDVFTIVRAQEGTSAKAIATGWQIANTATKLVFTDIENSIIQFISAGTTKASASEVVFGNANGVSFGASGQTITASVAGAGQTTQPVAASASNGSFLFSTLGFSNANNVTFGTSAGSIITASVAAGGGGAGSLSAGTSSIELGQVVFSNSNGVSFGLNGSTVTASHNGLTSQSAQAASASNGSFAFQTLGFSNANNVTFGTSAGSIVTASVTQSNQAASASNGSFAFQTLGFSNANGITFGTSAGSIITASVGAGVGAGSISAGTTSVALGQAVFSNSNGITFGLDGSTVTASHNGLTSQSNQAASASNGSFTFQTLGFSNANNVTFGTSAGSIITASVAPGAGTVNFSAGTTSADLTAVTFGNANGVSFGLDAGTITASVNAGAAGNTMSFFQNEQPGLTVTMSNANVLSTSAMPFVMPLAFSASYQRFVGLFNGNQATLSTLASSMNASAECYTTFWGIVYSLGTGASSNSLMSHAIGSAAWTVRNSLSVGADGTSGSYTQGLTGVIAGAVHTFTTQYSVANTNYSFQSATFLTNYNSQKAVDLLFASSLSAGAYWMLFGFQTSSSADSARVSGATNCNIAFVSAYGNRGTGNFAPSPMGQTSGAAVGMNNFGAGHISSNAVGTQAAFNYTNVVGLASHPRLIFQLIRQA